MTTMSDEGDRMCPLCAEDMDLTDQQLKPCKCGYEICVWCWHHIIDMAEKDDMEGRCPACRTPYDKERIVGMAANCGRMVAEINAEKKQKSQKVKPKTSVEAKKHLSGVRVIQRNLVYIVGLPSNLCDETLLERREFFGQYGKVLKVSVSRPASPSGQQASNNNTCSGYITYAKEEEAVRCIQAVHNFVLEGKPLRACFGTTKYCHAWLRNMTCSNPDCLYLHDIGSQEDSFTKDEIISAYTRSRVPQIASNNLQRRLGSVLPPPVDDFSNCGTVSAKHVLKSAANQNTVSQVKAPPNGIVGKPAVLPAAASWGLRVSNCRTPSMSCSQSSIKQKVDTATSACLISSVNESTKQMSPWHDDPVTASRLPERRHVIHSDGISRPIESTIPGSRMDCRLTISDVSSEVLVDAVCTPADSAWNDDVPTESKISEERYAIHLDSRSRSLHTQRPGIGGECQTSGSDVLLGIVPDAACTSGILNSFSSSPPPPAPEVKDRCITVPLKDTSTVESTSPQGLSRRPISSDVDAISYDYTGVNGHIQSLCLGLSSVNIDSYIGDDYLNVDQPQSSSSNLHSTCMPGYPTLRLQERYSEHGIVCLASTPLRETSMSSDMDISDWSSESQKQISPTANEMNDSLAAGDEQVHRFPGVTNETSPSFYSSQSLNITNNSSNSFWRNDVKGINPLVSGDSSIMDKKFNKPLSPLKDNELTLFSRHKDEDLGSYSNLGRGFDRPESCTENVKCLSIVDVANIDETACMEMGESQIVSDILSLDFDPWDDSLSSDNNFAKLLSESHKKDESFKLSSSHRLQNSDQSRFSFARQENLASALESSLRDSGHSGEVCSLLKGSSGDGFQNGFLSNAFECPKLMANSNPTVSSDRISGVSRAKISAPPGFSMPSKAPPPGFSSQDRYDQAQGATYSENHLLASSYFGNQYQEHLIANTGDVEFIDPAILAVGKGRMPLGVNNSSLGLRPAFPAHFSTLENDLRLQLLMQQPMSSHQNLIADQIGDRFLPPNDAFITSQLLAQNFSSISPFSQMPLQHPRNSYISSSQWEDWNLQTGNDAGMAEILKNERFRLNNYFPGSEEHKFYIPSSGGLYSRAFGM